MSTSTASWRLRVACAAVSLALAAYGLAQAAPAASPAGDGDAAAPRVEVTGGWLERPAVLSNSVQHARFKNDQTYFDLFVHPAAKYADLMAYAKSRRLVFSKSSSLTNPKLTDFAKRQVAGRDTVEWEVTGDHYGQEWHRRFINLRMGSSYCTLECWTKSSNWAAAQPQFDLLVKSLK